MTADPLDLDMAAKHMSAVLDVLGFDTDRDGVTTTPMRFVKALDQLTWGRGLDPRRHLDVTFPAEGDAQVTVRNIPVTSLCEHHLLPFDGTITIAYRPRPGARIVGLSKLAWVATEYAARATVQERVTAQVADAVEQRLDPAGVAVVMASDHACMSLRGARAHGATTVTEVYRGVYADDALAQTRLQRVALGD